MPNKPKKYFWEYSFDLKIDLLMHYYPKRSYTQAYYDIKVFLINNGFDNKSDKQGSCYFTSKKKTFQEANKIIKNMFKELPWITLCLKKDAITVKDDTNYSNISYAKYLNNTIQQLVRLKEFYDANNIEYPSDLKEKFINNKI